MSKVKPGINDIKTKYPKLEKEWNYELNNGINPSNISAHSHKKYWWKCNKEHSYLASPGNRAYGYGCPYCAHKLPISGENDLATLYPSLAKEWDYIKNKGTKPSDVFPYTSKKYWWNCDNGHSYLASVANRTYGYGCPYCAHKLPIRGQNDLETVNPSLAKEWDYDKNKGIKPSDVLPMSNQKYWWKCNKGHSYSASIYARTNGDGCPFCSGHRVLKGFNDLATLNPKLAAEWDYEKNYPLLPEQVTKSSGKKVWWVCNKGHEWQTTIAKRNVDGLGCPYCSGRYPIAGENDLQTVNPLLAKEWHPTKNGNLTPQMVLPNSDKSVYWICPFCKHEWKAKISNRNHNQGCPNCAKRNKTSFPEQAVFYYIKHVFSDAINSYTDIFSNQMELDIYIPSKKIGIEYDGIYHDGQKRDILKYNICKENKIYLIRISEVQRENIMELCDYFIPSKYLRPYDGGLDKTIQELFSLLDISNVEINISKDKNKIYEQYLTKLKANSLAEKYPSIAKEWHPTKNGNLNPDMFNWGSSDKVWWRCNICGNEWEATIASRTSNNAGCPICAKKRTKQGQLKHHLKNGKNTLIAKYPEIAKEWNYTRNTNLDISQITPNSNEKMWWICNKGHEWKTTVNSRTRGTKCPYCSGKKVLTGVNDLVTKNPTLAQLWNQQKNNIFPNEIMEKSNKKVWWICDKGHEWEATVASMTRTGKCPYCSGHKVLSGFNDLKTLRPDLMEEWDYKENESIKPNEITVHSGKKAWWICKKCGNKWYAVIDSRSKGHGCPFCARERSKKNKNL